MTRPFRAIVGGMGVYDVVSELAHSDAGKSQVINFLSNTLGTVSDDLISAGQTLLTGVVQAYETIKNYTPDQITNAANGYQAILSSTGNLLDSLMPKTQDQ